MVFKLTFFTSRRQSLVYNRCERMDITKTPKDDRIAMLEQRVYQLELMLEQHLDSLLQRSMEELCWRRRIQLERYRQEHCKREQESRRPPVDEDEIDSV